MSVSHIELFSNRTEAGRVLARHLTAFTARPQVIVLGLPRGGVPVAFEVAQTLAVPLDILVVRKLGVPGREELAMGAIAPGVRVLNDEILAEAGITNDVLEMVIAQETAEMARREAAYRAGLAPPILKDQTVILIDDGLATGATMLAAITAVRQHHPASVVVAIPLAAPATRDLMRSRADLVVCPITIEPFRAVGAWYRDFSSTSDEDVRELMIRAQSWSPSPPTEPTGRL